MWCELNEVVLPSSRAAESITFIVFCFRNNHLAYKQSRVGEWVRGCVGVVFQLSTTNHTNTINDDDDDDDNDNNNSNPILFIVYSGKGITKPYTSGSTVDVNNR